MEFERTLFRVHEKFLSIEQVHKSVEYCFKASIILLCLTAPIFLYGNYRYLNQSECLQPHIDRYYQLGSQNSSCLEILTQLDPNNTMFRPDSFGVKPWYNAPADVNHTSETAASVNNSTGTSNDTNLRRMEDNSTTTTITTDSTIIKPSDVVLIRVVRIGTGPNNTDELYNLFEFSGSHLMLVTESSIREKYGFTQINVTLDINCYRKTYFDSVMVWLLDIEVILINEIIVTFQDFSMIRDVSMNRNYGVNIKNNITSYIWKFSHDHIHTLMRRENIFVHTFKRVFGVLHLMMGLFLISNITSIYNKMTIICAPIFILAACSCVSRPAQNRIDRENIYRAFPWIGMYLHTLDRGRRRKDRYIITAFISMMLVFYCLYLAALIFWPFLINDKPCPEGLDENFYALLALVEFLVLLFLRTRTTIKFFPKASIIFMLMFLYYLQYTIYGFYYMALFMTTWSVLGVLAYLLMHFEIPAVNWNPSYHYTPSLDSPRTLYSPIFSFSWFHDIPHLWTMFFPIYGRSHFTNAELAMVDRNYPLLMQTLENAAQGGPAINNAFDAPDDNGLNADNGFNINAQPPENNANNQNDNSGVGGLGDNRPDPGSHENLVAATGVNQSDSPPNLLHTTEQDFALDIPEEQAAQNARRAAWLRYEANTGNTYERIDDEV